MPLGSAGDEYAQFLCASWQARCADTLDVFYRRAFRHASYEMGARNE